MNLDEYREKSKNNHNLFWTLQSGEHQNLLDEAIDKIDELTAENARLKDQINNLQDILNYV